jgi:lipid-binding SYLF domain-containing protein
MIKYSRGIALIPILLAVAACSTTRDIPSGSAPASSVAPSSANTQLDEDARAALKTLLNGSEKARHLHDKATGILVFPSLIKAGLMIGGQGGNGVLLSREGKTLGYYNSTALSFGMQAGAQSFSEVMFFMTDDALAYLDKSAGWSIGVGPSIVVMDMGHAASLTSTTLQSDVYAFISDQRGLMAGAGVQGQKITKLD